MHIQKTIRSKWGFLRRTRDLETAPAGFRALAAMVAIERKRQRAPVLAQATALRFAATKAATASELHHIKDIRSALLTAAGISDKAANHLQESDKHEAIEGLISNFLEPAGTEFVEELVFRFLLTRGDTLGGSMRNVGGFMAQKKLTRAIIACLKLADTPCHWLHSQTKTWAPLPENDTDVELNLCGLSWSRSDRPRTLLYNLTIPIVKNNIDLSLLEHPFQDLTRQVMQTPASYIALGELKGGIDPAGADEHWKTAHTALTRIHNAFAKHKLKPHTFFIGAAIESKMAEEIWNMMKRGVLENAANLTNEDQITFIARWLCDL